MIAFSKENFISIKLKPWSDKDASELYNNFNGEGIPLLVYLNSDGIEIDRIVGCYPPNEYLNKITDIYNGINTFLSLKNDFLSGDRSHNILSKLSKKCTSNTDVDLCNNVYSYIINNSENMDSESVFVSELFFIRRY